MIEEFKRKITNKEYINTKLFNKIKEELPFEIPNDFDLNSYNENVVENDYIKYKDYFDSMYKDIDDNIHLDEEQIKAILTDEDYSLIIAGAGTGKTTTMASKVKYLVDIKGVSPSKIVVMSYTKKATKELENRIVIDFDIPANVTTFHSFGFTYIREIFKDRKCYVVDQELRNEIFTTYFKEEIFKNKDKLKEIMSLFTAQELNKIWVFGDYLKNNFNKYDSFEEYFDSYKKYMIAKEKNLKETVEKLISHDINSDDKIITIQGELVKSKGEAIIANFLYRNNIEYKYEKIYDFLMEDRRIYKPDFTLSINGEEVYIEYFGLSNYNKSSKLEMKRYDVIRKKKEQYHKTHNTKFIAVDYKRGENVEDTLRKELLSLGFTLKPRTYEEIYDRLLDNNPLSQLYPFKDFMYSTIDAVKSSNKRVEYKNVALDYINHPLRNQLAKMLKRQLDYIEEFYFYYQNKLYLNTEEYGFDFSDMIYYANLYLENLPKNDNLIFNYIIIDEYQDISQERYEFAKKVSDVNNAKVVAVGDDWQSIYSFAGSKIKYIYNFEKYFEGAKLLKITRTYRNSQELINYSGDFIMRNPNQIKKNLISNKNIANPVKFIKYKDDFEYETLKGLILKIHKENPTHKILILARTNKIIEKCYEDPELKDEIDTKIEFVGYEDIDIDAMTIHKSKGLTSDEVIVMGLYKNFPKKILNDFWFISLFKKDTINEDIAYAEERRLFYVALTRTKNHVYLLINENPAKRSAFISELNEIISKNQN